MVMTYSMVLLDRVTLPIRNPACGQPSRENVFSLFLFAPGNFVSQDRIGRPIPRHPTLSGRVVRSDTLRFFFKHLLQSSICRAIWRVLIDSLVESLHMQRSLPQYMFVTHRGMILILSCLDLLRTRKFSYTLSCCNVRFVQYQVTLVLDSHHECHVTYVYRYITSPKTNRTPTPTRIAHPYQSRKARETSHHASYRTF